MSYKIRNTKQPELNSVLQVRYNGENIIGIVEKVNNGKISILMLDRIGRIIINMSDNWTCLNILTPSDLRDKYNMLINTDVSKSVLDAYEKFKIRINIDK